MTAGSQPQLRANAVDKTPLALCVEELDVFYRRGGLWQQALDGVSVEVPAGGTLAVVGESGSGKSTLALAVMRLLPQRTAQVRARRMDACGLNLLAMSEKQLSAVRGRNVGMVFQDPVAALNPVLTIGDQLVEVLRVHRRSSRGEAWARAAELLGRVGLTPPEERLRQYPHQMSGGMCQRAVVAMALAGAPGLIIADEPTTALDVTVQTQILDLLRDLQDGSGLALLLITHDLGVAARIADSICVLQRGRVVETGPTDQVLQAPRHAYTKALLRCRPRLGAHPLRQPGPDAAAPAAAVLSTRDVHVCFHAGRGSGRRPLAAVDGVTIELRPGQTLGLVGESGCGKTTLGRTLCRLQAVSSGAILYQGRDLRQLERGDLAHLQREIQAVFQNPSASLNPRMTIERILAEPLEIHRLTDRRRRRAQLVEALELVGLGPAHLRCHPHQLSGGQKQRVAIARALITRPRLLICDEPTSSLDAAIQAQILTLLAGLQQRLGLSCLFISHDLAAVESLSHEIAVMYRGRIVEQGAAAQICSEPRHPYTRTLLAAARSFDVPARGAVLEPGRDESAVADENGARQAQPGQEQ